MPLLIYPHESNDEEDNSCESPSDPPSADITLEPGPQREKPTEETTSEPNYDALSEPSALTREGSMGKLSPVDIVR